MKSKRVGFLIMILLAVALTGFAQRARVVSLPNESTSDWFMNGGDNERGLQLNFKGRIEFTPDYREIAALSRDGFVRMRETRGTDLKRLEIETNSAGKVRLTYFVNDQTQTFDQEGRLWLATVMRAAVRPGGYDAPRRVAHLYQQGGAEAVYAVISLLQDDYGRRVYFEQLLTRHSLDAALVPQVIRHIAQDLGSAYEKREALNAVPVRYLSDSTVINELIAAAATLDSDHDRGLMLARFAQGEPLGGESLNGVLGLVTTLAKPYDRAEALIALHRGQPQAATQPAFYTAVNGVGTAYEQARVLLAVMNDRRITPVALKLVIESAGQLSQDYEMAGVLLRAASLSERNEEVRQCLIAAAKNMRSEYERGRVLEAVTR